MLLLLTAAVLIVMLAFPETDIGRSLYALLVEAPARRLARVSPGQVCLATAVAVLGVCLFMAFEADGLRFFGLLLPELAAWFAMFDVALFIDVFLVAAAVVGATRLRALREHASLVFRGLLSGVSIRRGGRRRSIRPRRSRPNRAGSDDPGPAWAGLVLAD